MHIKKGDTAYVISGKDKGKTGKVLQVFTKKGKAIVERINLVKRHTRARGQENPGGIVEKEAPLYLSNILLLCPVCHKPSRIGRRFLPDGKKVRYCRKCQEIVDKE